MPEPTPGQTIGPFYGFALPYAGGPDLVPADHPDAIRLGGRVLDGAGDPVPDALLELWQTGSDGRPVQEPGSLRRTADGPFTGWGRVETDPEGRWAFTTLRPGTVYWALTVFARGLLDGLRTRIYLPEHTDDPFLATLPPDRAATIVAAAVEGGYAFDVRLQGEGETVFLTERPHVGRGATSAARGLETADE